MVATLAPGCVLSAFVLAIALASPATAQTTGTGQPPPEPQAQQLPPGAEQPAGSPVLTAPTPAQTLPPPRTFGDVNGISSQVSTPYNLGPPPRQGRPNRNLFGVAPPNLQPLLTLDALVGGGLSGNPVVSQTVGAPGGNFGNTEGGSGAGTGSANLLYSYSKPRFSINASNIVYVDYYNQYANDNLQPRDIATFAVNFVPARNSRATVSLGYKNLPEFSFSELLDGDIGLTVPIHQDVPITAERYSRYGASADFTQRFSRRTTVDFSTSYGHGVLTSGSSWDTISYTISLNQNIARGLAVYAGYVYGQQVFVGSDGRESTDRHPTIRLGVDFARALSIARRTTVSFSAGVAQLQDRVENQTVNHIIGGASIQREFGRTWSLTGAYSRTARLIEALDQPVFTDSLTALAQGTLSRRLELKAGIGASAGQFGTRTGGTFDTYFGSFQASYGLSRNYAIGADYAYQYLANPEGEVPIVTSGLYSQQTARIYFKIWTPLLSRPRRP